MVSNSYVIRIKDHEESEKHADALIKSSLSVENSFQIQKFDATTSEQVPSMLSKERIEWTYPWDGEIRDMRSGLTLRGYETAVPSKRIACFFSHYRIWKDVVETNEPTLVFEHDAIFTKKLNVDLISKSRYDIIGINDPRGATRLSGLYWKKLQNFPQKIVPVPSIDDHQVPQGLPGNSAYYIKPAGAKKLLELVKEHGAWPNDAIMCRQLMPSKLGVLRTSVTTIQKGNSTTTL